MKLLLLNDYASLREGIKELLLRLYPGVEIHPAADGNEALRLYAECGPYDVVLTDIDHPGPNGLELAKAIWRRNFHQKVGFITAYSLSRTLFDGVLSQVFDGIELIDFVDRLYALSQAAPVEEPLAIGGGPDFERREFYVRYG